MKMLRALRLLPFLLLPGPAAIAQSDPAALQWLQRMYSATEKLSYSGTFVYQQGQHAETSRITHVVDAAGAHEKIESLDGTPREIVRNGDQIVCYLPASMTVKIDRQPGWRSFPAILPERLKELAEHYDVSRGGIERVAGYDCQLIVLEPRDQMRYGHRLWADVNTGMLLKAKTMDPQSGVMEQFTFTQLRVGGVDRERLKSRFARRGREWRVEDSAAARTSLASAGWVLGSLPPGFRTVAELTRTLGGTSGVGHIVLSDGLAAVSVFIEPSSGRQPQPGPMRQGAVNVYTRSIGGHRVTVVGDTPPESVKYIAEQIEFRK